MGIWLVAVLAGLGALVFGLSRYVAHVGRRGRARRAATAAGLAIPAAMALWFSRMLFDIFPGLTVVDTGALFVAGMVGGFCLGVHAVANRLDRKREV